MFGFFLFFFSTLFIEPALCLVKPSEINSFVEWFFLQNLSDRRQDTEDDPPSDNFVSPGYKERIVFFFVPKTAYLSGNIKVVTSDT